jgi:hypothetical protein
LDMNRSQYFRHLARKDLERHPVQLKSVKKQIQREAA